MEKGHEWLIWKIFEEMRQKLADLLGENKIRVWVKGYGDWNNREWGIKQVDVEFCGGTKWQLFIMIIITESNLRRNRKCQRLEQLSIVGRQMKRKTCRTKMKLKYLQIFALDN